MKLKTQVIYFGARQNFKVMYARTNTHMHFATKFSLQHVGSYVHYSVCVQERQYPQMRKRVELLHGRRRKSELPSLPYYS